jgi:hypothetical protein
MAVFNEQNLAFEKHFVAVVEVSEEIINNATCAARTT